MASSIDEKVEIQSSVYFDDNINFSNNQKKFINTMIAFNSESLKDFYGENAPGYELFLQNHQITPEKEKAINEILKVEYDLNPYLGDGFNKPELQKIKKRFDTNNRELPKISQKYKRDFLTYKRRLSYLQPRPSTHTITTRSNTKRKRSRGKTKKKKKKNKKKKRKSYKK